MIIVELTIIDSQMVQVSRPIGKGMRISLRKKRFKVLLITAGTDNPHVESFTEWMRSKQGQEIVKKSGYLPVGE
ncbi:hypothetical protein NCCP2222_09680 [Sporosarcina sp. NCCP-2222]|nr:hypothetical protein NCCP2222_09680 [Sporosarcina sp. NCCP-2222]